MKTLHVFPAIPNIGETEITFRAVFEGFDSGSKTIEIIVPRAALSQLPLRADHFALAALFPAMREFDACVVHGELGRPVLENLSELNAIWHVWRPQTYRPVQWSADKVVESPVAPAKHPGHLLAFSGGVDATTTLLRHRGTDLGWRKRDIKGALIIQGFDIPLGDHEGFRKACARAERIMSDAGVPLIMARTNLRELPGNWEDAFAAKLASVLHVFNETFEGALFGSCEGYASPKLPWGSNPVSNHLLGTNQFPVRTDGAELTRLEKVRLLCKWPVGVQNIRVCWEGNLAGENCGACEKCVRTQLEFAACGVVAEESFRTPLRPGMVQAIRPKNVWQLAHLKEILDYAKQNNLSAWWAKELGEVIRRGSGPPRGFWARFRKH